MGTRMARLGALASALGLFVVYFGGPSWFVVGLPLALTGILFGAQSLALTRTSIALAACIVGLLALLIPAVQFVAQS